MSVLRAILGRFARLLVRIARTLDPGLAAAPYRVAPERMAALRQRYPGAPAHWLELLARRTNLGDGPAAPPNRTEAEATPQNPAPRFKAPQPGQRPAPRFPAAARVRRVIARTGGPDRAWRPPAEAPSPASRQARPMLTFAAAQLRKPIAYLLRGRAPGQRGDGPRFADGPPGPPRDSQVGLTDCKAARLRHETIFPGAEQHSAYHAWIGPKPAEPGERMREAAPGWPEFRFSAPPGPSWPAGTSRQERPNPRFAALDGRWPELPAFLDESGTTGLSASDEAALLAEQIGGKWSA